MDFEKSAWADEKFAGRYIDRADIYIPERTRMLRLVLGINRALHADRRGLRVTDLGCGDGIVTSVFFSYDYTIKATLVDASEDMLARARRRVGSGGQCTYLKASFDDLIDGRVTLPKADLVVSSMAIHHNEMSAKRTLFGLIYGSLDAGGSFINMETVKPLNADLERMYFSMWAEAMQAGMTRAGITDEKPQDVIDRYTDPKSQNRPDTLEDQLDALRDAGFRNVDSYYKNGIFAIFGGQRLK